MRVLVFSLLLALASSLSAQAPDQVKVQELLSRAHNKALPVADRLQAYQDLGWDHYLRTSTDSAIWVADAMMALADSARAQREAVMALRLKAVALADKGDLPGAIAEAERALERCQRHGLHELLPKVYTSLGIFLNQIGDLGQAMAFHTKALQLYERDGDGSGMASALNNLGFVHYDARDTTQALASFKRAVSIRDSLGIGHMNINALGNIGGMYMDRKRPLEALPYLKQALAIAESTEDPVDQARALSNLGTCYKQLGERALAMSHLERSTALARQIGIPGVEAVNLMVMSELAETGGDVRGAMAFATQALELAQAGGDLYVNENAVMRLYALHKAAGDLRQALTYHEKGMVLRDSLANDRNRSEVMRQQSRYEFEKREAQQLAEQDKKDAVAGEKLRRREMQRNVSIGAVLALMVVALIIWRQRNRISKEKARSEELLLNILPAEVADELKDRGEARARHFDSATILFTDFKGFTQLSEKVTPEELVAELNTCFKAFDGIMGKYRIEKIKTIGDAYMAAGGLPDTSHGSPVDVVHAALEMQDFMERYKAERQAAGKPFFEMRLGIHTGPVVAGIVGVKKFQYDIWGDTVNTASRMESSGEVGQVNISESTYALVKDAEKVNGEGRMVNGDDLVHSPFTNSHSPVFHFTPRGKVQAKGKGEMEMFFVRRSSEGA